LRRILTELNKNTMTSKDFFKEVKLEWCVSEQQDKPLLNDMMKFAKLYHKEQLNLSGVVDRLPQDPIILARYLHEAYEMLAKNNDWNTQENCKVDFSDLPIGNKNTMILLAGKLILDFGGN